MCRIKVRIGSKFFANQSINVKHLKSIVLHLKIILSCYEDDTLC